MPIGITHQLIILKQDCRKLASCPVSADYPVHLDSFFRRRTIFRMFKKGGGYLLLVLLEVDKLGAQFDRDAESNGMGT